MRAVRNIRLCTKDCLCLYVCPTGATDTENGQIDWDKCLDACRACVDACPSGAICKVPHKFPLQQPKTHEVITAIGKLSRSKARQWQALRAAQQTAVSPVERQVAQALEQSLLISAQDLARESGYMLPQSQNARALLEQLLKEDQGEGFPAQAARTLLEKL